MAMDEADEEQAAESGDDIGCVNRRGLASKSKQTATGGRADDRR